MFDPVCVTTILNQVNTSDAKRKMKEEITRALIISGWTQRIYFDVRSMMMTVLGALITLAVFWQVRTVDLVGDFLLGLTTYLVALMVSRLFDSKIVNISRALLEYLEEHTKLRDLIVNSF